ncbi:hypothetical protein [Pedobacter sp. JCM 36344]|uniref:hypothetical protein n=1 Tax=Pedobacter sp. JCM 36344 TaxID=3374280 RepID=UPI00397CA5C4
MRKCYTSIIFLLLSVTFYSCIREGTYKITGELGLPDQSVVTLWPDDNSHQIAGVTVADHKFQMKIEALDEGVYNLLISWKNPNRQAQILKNGSRLGTPDTLFSRTRIYLDPNSDYHITSPIKDISNVSIPTRTNLNPFPINVNTNSEATKELQSYLAVISRVTLVFQKKLDSLNFLATVAQAKDDMINYRKIMDEYEGLDDGFFKGEIFRAREAFIDRHKTSPVSAYLIATAPDLKDKRVYYQQAVRKLDAALQQNRYTIEAKRRLAIK